MGGLVCLSGGATGADQLWGNITEAANGKTEHFTFKGHRAWDWDNAHRLSTSQMKKADLHLIRANQTLKRSVFPYERQHTNNLLRRNWYQVRDASAVYALAMLSANCTSVMGGTAWAIQMFIDRFPDATELPVYVCDETGVWHHWVDGEFHPMMFDPPCPSDRFAGIGSREVTKEQVTAAFRLFGYAGGL